MANYLLKELNEAAPHDPAGLVAQGEAHYTAQVDRVARAIAERQKTNPIILISGPSSAGKTTTTARIAAALQKDFGIHAEQISMDDYYKTVGTYERPWDDENNIVDLESPLCMNLELLADHLKKLVAGEEISAPRFDFETRHSIPDVRTLTLDPGEVVLIEGIHALSNRMFDELGAWATGLYLAVDSTVTLEDGTVLEPRMLRFLRRAVRDSLFRGHPVDKTLEQWPSIRRGERLYIKPNRQRAALSIDSYMPYETFLISRMIERELSGLGPQLEQAGLAPLAGLSGAFAPLDAAAYIPADSLIHEFIG